MSLWAVGGGGAHQVGHDDGVVHEGVLAHAQGELQAAGRLARGQVETVALQQQMLQLVLGRHQPVHLAQTHTTRQSAHKAADHTLLIL